MRRQIIVLVSAVAMVLPALVACARGSSQPPGPTGIERLRRDATGELHVMWDQESGKPAFIRGRIRLWPIDLRGKADPAAVALAFVGYYGEAFGLKDAKAEVELEEVVAEEPWTTQVTLRQMYQGVEVYNARMRVYVGGDGQEVVMVSNGFVPGIALANVKPRLSAHQALTAARVALPKGELTCAPKLVVYPGASGERSGASATLAWLVELRDETTRVRNVYVVDGIEGVVLDVLARPYGQHGHEGDLFGQDGCVRPDGLKEGNVAETWDH